MKILMKFRGPGGQGYTETQFRLFYSVEEMVQNPTFKTNQDAEFYVLAEGKTAEDLKDAISAAAINVEVEKRAARLAKLDQQIANLQLDRKMCAAQLINYQEQNKS